VHKIARQLKASLPLALISNIDVLHLDYIKKKFSILELFQSVIASCEVNVAKPHPLIYQKILDALGVDPQNAFYTDDRPELVEAAKRLGIKGFVFRGTQQLYKDLSAAGINLN
jgi:HAD superfamily hydrolase (TIGR01549 family)